MPGLTDLVPQNLLTDNRQRYTWKAYLLLVLMCCALFLPGLASIPPVDRDEPRFAQATKQMIESGNYVDIRFQSEARYKKPIGIYWLQAASVKILNPGNLDEIWAYRVPSFLGATLSVIMTAKIGCLLFGPLAGLLAALLLASSLLLNVEARLAKTDAVLLACTMVAQYALAKIYVATDKEPQRSWGNALAFWTAQAVAFLIKGPLLVLITFFTVLALRVAGKKPLGLNALKPWFGVPYALLLVLPWFIAIMMASQGDFASESFGRDFLGKIWQSQNRGSIPPGFHFLLFPFVYFPGSLLVLLAIPAIYARRHEPPMLFCLSWLIPLWIIFELSMTKLPHYTLPLYPAAALLAAHTALTGMSKPLRKIGKNIQGFFAFVWFAGATVIVTGVGFVPSWLKRDVSGEGVLAALCGLAMIIGLWRMRKYFSRRNVLIAASGGLMFVAVTFGTVIPNLPHVWLSPQIVNAAHLVKPCQTLQLASSAYNEPSLIFLAGTGTKVNDDADLIARWTKSNPCALAIIDTFHEANFMKALQEDDITPEELTRFRGFNIGSGKRVDIGLYRLSARM